MDEVIRREKAETWERVAQIEKKVNHHESKIQVRWPSSKVVHQ